MPHIRIPLFFACLEQVREEGPAKVSLVEDEAHKPNHGNTASGDLKLQGKRKAEGTEQRKGVSVKIIQASCQSTTKVKDVTLTLMSTLSHHV
jgi:hypothetical protein